MRRKAVIPASIRLQVIARDNGRCRACGMGDVDALQCDHIVPESKGGDSSLENLQALCGVCNNRKGNTDIGELPVRECIDGFGDYATVMVERSSFVRLLDTARKAETEKHRIMLRTWREAQVKGYIIRRRLSKIMDPRKVDSLMRGVR
jgi:hypothetical protein